MSKPARPVEIVAARAALEGVEIVAAEQRVAARPAVNRVDAEAAAEQRVVAVAAP